MTQHKVLERIKRLFAPKVTERSQAADQALKRLVDSRDVVRAAVDRLSEILEKKH